MRQPEVETIQVVKVTSNRGTGSGTDLVREVTGYYTTEGRLIHEDDPLVTRHYGIIESAPSVAGSERVVSISSHMFPDDVGAGRGVMIEVQP